MSGQYLYSNSDYVEMVVWNKVNYWYRLCQFNILNDDAKSPKNFANTISASTSVLKL